MDGGMHLCLDDGSMDGWMHDYTMDQGKMNV